MRILITGSRDWIGVSAIALAMRKAVGLKQPSSVTIVHGGARGADTDAHNAAKVLGYQIEKHPADWNTHGKAAGVIRNQQMVDAGADVCLAFIRNNSKGASHCAAAAEAAGIPVTYYRVDDR